MLGIDEWASGPGDARTQRDTNWSPEQPRLVVGGWLMTQRIQTTRMTQPERVSQEGPQWPQARLCSLQQHAAAQIAER